MKFVHRTYLAVALVAVALPVGASQATAQTWPARPVIMMVPFPVGGGGDLYGRIFANRLSELLGQPVVVENVPGTGGMAGAARVARTAPDGCTFLWRARDSLST